MGAGVQRLVSASDLKRQRGWTEGLVVKLLGSPDALCPNPHGFRAPMRWYREDRILDAERTSEEFAARLGVLSERQRWRREQPTRVLPAREVPDLEWLEDPALIALFLAPRVPRRRRRRPPQPVAPVEVRPELRFEVLTLF